MTEPELKQIFILFSIFKEGLISKSQARCTVEIAHGLLVKLFIFSHIRGEQRLQEQYAEVGTSC